tara:strand:- start:25486 stop:25773 length:288 start_codon:yes stop_codon:yes gene_type:complete
MSNVAIVGSRLDVPDGIVLEGQAFCRINGSPITHVGATGTTHSFPEPHPEGQWQIKSGPGFFKVNGLVVATVGSPTTCNHVVTTGGFVKVGGSIQ